jgi:hypothetical protein
MCSIPEEYPIVFIFYPKTPSGCTNKKNPHQLNKELMRIAGNM